MQMEIILERAANALDLSEDDLVRESLRLYLERQLRQIQAEIYRITGQYGIKSVEEMEKRYRNGTLEEANTWRDHQRLDHLEYKRDRLTDLLENVP